MQSRPTRVEVLEMRRCHTDGAWLARAELLEIAPEVSSAYREAWEDDRVVELDTLGGLREPLLIRWTITSSFDDMFERLRALSVWCRDDDSIDIENGPDDARRILMTWYEPAPSVDPDDWKMIAFLYLEEGRLAAHVATRAVAERLMGEVSARLGSAATHVETRSSMPVRVHARAGSFPVLVE